MRALTIGAMPRDCAVAPHRQCRRCGQAKPLTEFHRRSDTGGVCAWCKPCKADYGRERWRRVRAAKRDAKRPVELSEAKRLRQQREQFAALARVMRSLLPAFSI